VKRISGLWSMFVVMIAIVCAGIGTTFLITRNAIAANHQQTGIKTSNNIQIRLDEVCVLGSTGDIVGAGELNFVTVVVRATESRKLTGPSEGGIKAVKGDCIYLGGYTLQVNELETTEQLILTFLAADQDDLDFAQSLAASMAIQQLTQKGGRILRVGRVAADMNPLILLIDLVAGTLFDWASDEDIIGEYALIIDADKNWEEGRHQEITADGSLSLDFTICLDAWTHPRPIGFAPSCTNNEPTSTPTATNTSTRAVSVRPSTTSTKAPTRTPTVTKTPTRVPTRTPIPTPIPVDLRSTMLDNMARSNVQTRYTTQAQLLAGGLVNHLYEFQLPSYGITPESMTGILSQRDAAMRLNALVREVWGEWLKKANQGGFSLSSDPSGKNLSPFRQLIIRMIQGRQGALLAHEQHGLFNFLTRPESASVWTSNMDGVIGAVNRESFQWP